MNQERKKCIEKSFLESWKKGDAFQNHISAYGKDLLLILNCTWYNYFIDILSF